MRPLSILVFILTMGCFASHGRGEHDTGRAVDLGRSDGGVAPDVPIFLDLGSAPDDGIGPTCRPNREWVGDMECPPEAEANPFARPRLSRVSEREFGASCVVGCGCSASVRLGGSPFEYSFDDPVVEACICDAIATQSSAIARFGQGAAVGPCLFDIISTPAGAYAVFGCDLSERFERADIYASDCADGRLRIEAIARVIEDIDP